jgi:hypothetical protein
VIIPLYEIWSGNIGSMLQKCLESVCTGRQFYVIIFVASWYGFMYNSFFCFYIVCVILFTALWLVERFLYASDSDGISMTV